MLSFESLSNDSTQKAQLIIVYGTSTDEFQQQQNQDRIAQVRN